MVVVTHEMGFARRAANRVVFMDGGRIVETAEPGDLLHHPAVRPGQGLPLQDPHPLTAPAHPARGPNTCSSRRTALVAALSVVALTARRLRRRRRATSAAEPTVAEAARVRGGHDDGRARRGRHDHHRHEVRPAAASAWRASTARPRASTSRSPRSSPARWASPRRTSPGSETPSAVREEVIEDGEVDMVVATYTINDARKERISFAGPYYVAGQQHHGRRRTTTTSPARSPSRTNPDAKVCSVTGSTPAEQIKEYLASPDQLVLFDVYSQCADALSNGQVDAVTTDNVILLGLRRRERRRLQARRRAVHRGALRHRHHQGRRRLLRVHQRDAAGATRTPTSRRGSPPRARSRAPRPPSCPSRDACV